MLPGLSQAMRLPAGLTVKIKMLFLLRIYWSRLLKFANESKDIFSIPSTIKIVKFPIQRNISMAKFLKDISGMST